MDPCIYIVLNGSLKMSSGKAAAQAVHAVMLLSEESRVDFVTNLRRTVIVLEAKDSEQIKNIAEYLCATSADSDYYIDEGVNEVDAYSITALAVYAGDNEEVKNVFSALPLYGKKGILKHL